jgi:hypothetical protein
MSVQVEMGHLTEGRFLGFAFAPVIRRRSSALC